MARKRVEDKRLRSIKKSERNCLKIVFSYSSQHLRPHIIFNLFDLKEDVPLPAIARR